MKTKTLYLLCGLPCSGKSTYIKNNFSNINVLSRDEELLKYGHYKFRSKKLKHREIWKKINKKDQIRISDIFDRKLKRLIELGEDIVIDRMLITKESRKKIIKQVGPDYNIKIIFMNVNPVELLFIRNEERFKKEGKYVKPEILKDMIKKLQIPTKEESSQITDIKIINQTFQTQILNLN